MLTILNRSLLPAWAKYRYHKDVTGQELRNAVFLRQRWNEELEKRVDHWAGGKVMLWDAGQWFIDTLRSGRKGGWKDVRSACLEDGKKCEHPERYLMWSVFSILWTKQFVSKLAHLKIGTTCISVREHTKLWLKR